MSTHSDFPLFPFARNNYFLLSKFLSLVSNPNLELIKGENLSNGNAMFFPFIVALIRLYTMDSIFWKRRKKKEDANSIFTI